MIFEQGRWYLCTKTLTYPGVSGTPFHEGKKYLCTLGGDPEGGDFMTPSLQSELDRFHGIGYSRDSVGFGLNQPTVDDWASHFVLSAHEYGVNWGRERVVTRRQGKRAAKKDAFKRRHQP